MIHVDIRSLLGKLNPACTSALESAAGLAISQGCYEVQVEHLLFKLLQVPEGDAALILHHFGVTAESLEQHVRSELELVRRGNAGRPVWSPLLLQWIRETWLVASVDLGARAVRSGHLLLVLARQPESFVGGQWEPLRGIDAAALGDKFEALTKVSGESDRDTAPRGAAVPGSGAPAQTVGDGAALARYTVDFSERARAGQIDPVFGRDREIRQVVDILARRRKNNPILVGEAGVGKTALVEGLALLIALGEAPESLRDVRILGLDLSLLQAGAGVRGEFENRLNQVIKEVKASTTPIILFIDEAHTLMGAGGAQGTGDAANLLKPALARGELRTLAATTFSEYKKFIEKDAALERRFQEVRLAEPSEEQTITILRGLAGTYEKAHGVRVYDDAVAACARLGSRYLSGRQHPDKGVDLLDTACARVKVGLSGRPTALESRERRIQTLQRELAARRRDESDGVAHRHEELERLEQEIASVSDELASWTTRWKRERGLAERVLEMRKSLAATPDGEARTAESRLALDAALAELRAFQGKEPILDIDVTPETVARVVADWTGIPLGRMVEDEARTLLELEQRLRSRIRGQDPALASLAEAIRSAKAGVTNPRAPLGVFLCVGPSGVGKTECALALADVLFGGERFLTTINMSEFQEKHTVSRLIGSPPGYVGYGEGGVLTEAVRQRPYSLVLLDEVEKADPEVLNLFYQVFDKGTLADGEGREIDFSNTVVYMTSNLASAKLTELGVGDETPSARELVEAIRPDLARHFKPALLARMQVVPFLPLPEAILGEIVTMKLTQVANRLAEARKAKLSWDPEVAEAIVARCDDVDSGARNVEHILRATLLPRVSARVLEALGRDGPMPELRARLDSNGEIAVTETTDIACPEGV